LGWVEFAFAIAHDERRLTNTLRPEDHNLGLEGRHCGWDGCKSGSLFFSFFKAKITGALVVLYLEYSPVEIAFCFSSYRSIRVGKSQGRMDDLEMEREVDGLIARPVFVLLERGGVEKRSS
jgi:hypothetical protein